MTTAQGLALLFSRDLTRLIQELEAFPNDEPLWARAPGVKEFALAGISRDDLVRRMEEVRELVAKVVSELGDGDLAKPHPERVLEQDLCSRDLLIHLHGHVNFHLGQIDYLRRILTEGSAVAFVGL